MTSMSERLANLTPDKLALLKKAMGNSQSVAEPIAIVGMGCRFAGVSNVTEYWQAITEAIERTGEIPASRWSIDEFFDAKGGTPGKMTTRWGGFLDNIDRFDASFFGISPREAEKMDPQHRLLLEVVWEALEYGGISPFQLRESATGVFVGIGGVDYSRIPVQLNNYFEQITAYSGTGNALSIAANRISYTLDLRGPSLSIDTACSSSLVAAHLAIRSLRTRECDMAIVGGVNAILTPETTLAFSQAQMLSSDGKCRPFDHRANGYVRGEGCGAIVLKRLSDATSDRNNILAVIRGSAINQDGLTSGITAPRATAQVAVIQQALKDAGLKSTDISYIEAHGTATPLGDPIEVSALNEVFQLPKNDATSASNAIDTCYFGSVKANIGHTETAAGMASLIKTILMLRHQLIPRQLHFESLNPHIRIEGSRLKVADQQIPWEINGNSRIAGVSSFGFGGTNSHLILEEFATKSQPKSEVERSKHVLTLSAKSPESLRELAVKYQHTVCQETVSGSFPDICYTAATGRAHFNYRLAVVADNETDLQTKLSDYLDGGKSKFTVQSKTRGDRRFKIAFLFPGQGAQFPQMGRQLYQQHPVFRNAIDRCDEYLQNLLPQRLLEVLFEPVTDKHVTASNSGVPQYRIHQTLYTQPALFSIGYALAQLWRSFGITPSVVAGHSVGDYVAACDAGVFSLEDGLRLIAHRARLVDSLPRNGLMAAVMASAEQVADWISPYSADVSVAVHNSPQNTVISGRTDVVTELLETFHENGVQTRVLDVSHAMHSPLLDPILDDFEKIADEVIFHPPHSPWISSSDGTEADAKVCSPKYWRDHLRNTVRFVDSARSLKELAVDAAIEMGPGTTLCSLTAKIWGECPALLLPSLRSAQTDWDVLLTSLSQLYVHGANVDWNGFDTPYNRSRVILPTYPFERQSHWYDMSRKVVGGPAIQLSRQVPHSDSNHPLLGSRLPVAGDKVVFEAILGTSSPAFLADHRVDQNAVFPAAGYVELGFAAAQELFGPGQHSVADLFVQQAMVFTENQARVAQVHVGPDQRGERTFDVYSRSVNSADNDKTVWIHHATGLLQLQSDASTDNLGSQKFDLSAIKATLTRVIDPSTFYQRMTEVGLKYGPNFSILDSIQAGADECLARISIPKSVDDELSTYTLHPAILDGCLQSMAGAIHGAGSAGGDDLLLPTLVQQTQVLGKFRGQSLWIHTKLRDQQGSTDSYTADLKLFDSHGHCVANVSGARVQRVSRHSKGRSNADLVYATEWIEKGRESDTETAAGKNGQQLTYNWLVLADSNGFGETVAKQLALRGDHVTLAFDGEQFTQLDAVQSLGLEGQGLEGQYTLCPTSLPDYEQLLESIGQRSEGPLNTIDCRSVQVATGDTHAQTPQDQLAAANTRRLLMTLQALAKTKKVKIAQVCLVTAGAQQIRPDEYVSPAQSALWGMARCAMIEMPHLSLRLVDVDNVGPAQSGQTPASSLVSEIVYQASGHGDSEDHVAIRGAIRFVGRLRKSTCLAESGTKAKQLFIPDGRIQLRANTASGIEGLYYAPIKSRTLLPNEVEIEVRSAGLNFSDVLKAMGLYPGVKDAIVPLGIECAGVVTKIGEAVTDFEIGQRVMGVAPYSFASHTTTADYAIVATPENLSDDEAATIPITFLTAYHALITLARLAPGERLLIHAGAGGVGQAAIQIAKEVGAEIFTTAGSEEKRDFLRALGVEHVLDSRTLRFAEQIVDITAGQGVDVVLNSLPGEAITKSLSVLSAYGRFLEIGKTDIYLNRKVGLWPFQDNLSYFAIDLDRMLRQRPAEIKRLYAEVIPKFANETYKSLPFKRFTAEKVTDAYRYMVQRRNIGKVVVSFSTKNQSTAIESKLSPSNSAQGTVLITGGLGALGQQVAKWAIDRGASHLVIVTRQNPDSVRNKPDSVRNKLAELLETNTKIAVVQGDVTNFESLRQSIDSIPSDFPPIRGVIHAAGVLQDGLMQTMDLEQLEIALAPKVKGAWNLYKLLAEPLDYFIMFSSVAGTIGSPGQGNYAAGNAFLDGLATNLRTEGVPAVSIAWGPWGAAGMAANEEVRKQLSERGMRPLEPDVAISLMDAAVKQGSSNLTITDTDWGTLLSKLPIGGSTLLQEFRVHRGSLPAAQHRQGDRQLIKQLAAAEPAERQSILQKVIASSLGDVMGVDADSIDVEQPLASLGLDSLMGMELRTSLETKLGFEMPMNALMDDPSVNSLATVANQILTDSGGQSPDAANADVLKNSDGAESSKPKKIGDQNRRSDLVTLGGTAGLFPPLFCVHPVGGDLRCYDNFARSMQNRLVYGLRAHGLQAGTTPHTSLERMIDDYVAAIRNQQPTGPYCLMGWSTGGIFAYEITRRLLDLKLEVKPLIMVDAPLPSVFEKVDLNDNARFLVDLIEFANYFAGTSMQVSYEQLRDQSENASLTSVLELAIKHNVLPAQTNQAHLKRLIDVCRWHVEFLQSYTPPALQHRVHLLRPEDTSILSEAARQEHSDDFGWSNLVELQLHRVSGHHFTMMTGRNATSIAAVIEGLLLDGTPQEPSSTADSRQFRQETTSGI